MGTETNEQVNVHTHTLPNGNEKLSVQDITPNINAQTETEKQHLKEDDNLVNAQTPANDKTISNTDTPIYKKIEAVLDELNDFLLEKTTPNTAANFIRRLPNITLTQQELSYIFHNKHLSKDDKSIVNDYYDALQKVLKIIKLTLNFKNHFNITNSKLITSTAYLQTLYNDKQKIIQESDEELRLSLEQKLEDY